MDPTWSLYTICGPYTVLVHDMLTLHGPCTRYVNLHGPRTPRSGSSGSHVNYMRVDIVNSGSFKVPYRSTHTDYITRWIIIQLCWNLCGLDQCARVRICSSLIARLLILYLISFHQEPPGKILWLSYNQQKRLKFYKLGIICDIN